MEVLSPAHILSNLSDLREEGLLCDIELQVEGEMISAHRALLAAVSPYFKVLFSGGFKEVTQKVIEIKGVSFNGLKGVIDCCYETTLDLNTDNLSDILSAATLVQISQIIDHCKVFMSDNLSELTCFLFLNLAEKFFMQDVKEKTVEYILRNFTTVRKVDEFKEISKDSLIQYLSHDHLNVKGDESEAFYAAKDWLQADPDRMQFTEEVLKNIRFHMMDSHDLCDIGDMNIIDSRKECRVFIREALAFNSKQLDLAKPLKSDFRARPRGREGILVLESLEGRNVPVDGWQSLKENHVYLCPLTREKEHQDNSTGIQSNTKKHMQLQTVNKFVRNSTYLMEVNNFVFLFATDNESFEPVAMRYEPARNEWISLTPAPCDQFDGRAVVGSSIALIDEGGEIYIYLISGMPVSKESTFDSDKPCSRKVLRYDIAYDTWKVMPDIPTASYYSAAIGRSSNGYYPVDEFIYVTGGNEPLDKESKTKTYAFDVRANLWLCKPPMKYGRYAHCMALVNNMLYVIGGYGADRIETFDIIEEQWTDLENVNINVAGSCAIVRDETILILGGKSNNNLSSDVMVFNTRDQKVKVHKKCLPQPMWCPIGALIVHPALL